jgi:DNA mismatch endonuclease, patch repair protein
MQAIRSKDTKPELQVRRLLHRLGYRFRLHRRDLPGKPDIVLPGRRKVIFVHGCFWHSHPNPACRNSQQPKTNEQYWEEKLSRTRERDSAAVAALNSSGWEVLTLWECELGEADSLERRLSDFLGPRM